MAPKTCFEQLLEFIHWLAEDISPLVQALTAFVGLIGLWFVYQQVRDARQEAETARRQARRDAAYGLIDGVAFSLLEKSAHDECKKAGISFPAKLTAGDLITLRKNIDAYFAVKSILVTLEKLSLAYNQEYSDCEVMERTYGGIVIGYWEIFEEIVGAMRTEAKTDKIYAEFEKAALNMKTRVQP